MNYTRLVVAAVGAWVVNAIYTFVVYGWVLSDRFTDYPGVFRPVAACERQPAAVAVGSLLTMFAVAYIYAKRYHGPSRVQEGMGFGVLLGIIAMGVSIGNYVSLNIGPRLAASSAAAGFIGFVIVGVTIGAV